MGRKKIDTIHAKSKMQSLIDGSKESLKSKTGYKDTGNTAEVHAKARALR